MKIMQITLDDGEFPTSLVAELSIGEAVVLAKMTGKYSSLTATEEFGELAECTTSVYDALTGGVFNRFWDDGVNDAAKSPR